MKQEKLMTESEWIERFSKKGFGLYKVKEVMKKYKALNDIESLIKNVFK